MAWGGVDRVLGFGIARLIRALHHTANPAANESPKTQDNAAGSGQPALTPFVVFSFPKAAL